MSNRYVQTALRSRIPVVNDALAEPKTLFELRDVLRRRARNENGHMGRSCLSESTIIDALAALERGSHQARAVGFTENFLGGTGLATIRGLSISLTEAGAALLNDARRRGVSA